MLQYLANCTTIEEAVMFLLSFDNALSYNKESFSKNYERNISEQEMLGLELCGIANCKMAFRFMEYGSITTFFENVAFNSVSSVPLILRAIQIRMSNNQ